MTSPHLYDFSGLTVLIADDEEINCLLTEAILGQSGLEVTIVSNGSEAVAAARTACFDLIILDIQMPVMDGLEACALLRKMEQDTVRSTPIIAMTAHGNGSFRQKCLEHGFSDYISKPFKSTELLAKMAEHLASSSAA